MSGRSAIEWTQATWNPVTGCSKVSPGCAHCYGETFAERFRGVAGHHFEQGFDLRLWPDRLDLPLTWRKPRLIFVNSMSDLFHPQIPESFLARVSDTMARARWHTFQLLTKGRRFVRLDGLVSQLATAAARPDEAGGPPPTKFYELRDNLRRAAGTDPTHSGSRPTDGTTPYLLVSHLTALAGKAPCDNLTPSVPAHEHGYPP